MRLEYETLFALGSLCGVSDPDAVLRAARLCDRLGLDTISAGATIAFAMECAERGLLHEPDLRFGNADVMLALLERIARREGLGNLLAEGSRRAAASLGGGAEDFAPHVKGLELPGYEPRALDIEVRDEGGTGRRDVGEAASGGRGLIGMRERVAIFDGEFEAGPIPGGFRVHARLPVEAEPVAEA